ncbi:MAG: R.Pab1 family restriction endonuclease [Alphaproteobacteria bacterium GM202ARS2]|nr:R.Pab1 family restriction endonuclease [Alphaproteobacteria bacterium GM202ARS2]
MRAHIHEVERKIEIRLPLTTPTGKVRVKKRDEPYQYGRPVATKRDCFTSNTYIEWQISYDEEEGRQSFSTIPDVTFVGYRGIKKSFYELSEYLYYFYRWGFVEKNDLELLLQQLMNLKQTDLLSHHRDYQIERSEPIKERLNGLAFYRLTLSYPQLVYQRRKGDLTVEITIREKQRAVGVQPMLYLCIPVKSIMALSPLLGRTASTKEEGSFFLCQKDSCMVLDIIRVFGMLSESHQADIISILSRVLEI